MSYLSVVDVTLFGAGQLLTSWSCEQKTVLQQKRNIHHEKYNILYGFYASFKTITETQTYVKDTYGSVRSC